MKINKIKIGLLPLYLKLYDDFTPDRAKKLQDFYDRIAADFVSRGVEVVTGPICRLSEEFSQVIENFEKEGAMCIVTLHLAYSPSLESVPHLVKTKLPIVVLDTTVTYEFGFSQSTSAIGPNHGIHGVMDMCNMLKRNGKEFAIAAGHFYHSDVIERTIGFIKAGVAANSVNGSKTGSIAGSFQGMGDFLVTAEEMKERFGVEIVTATSEDFDQNLSEYEEDSLLEEFQNIKASYVCNDNVSFENYKITSITEKMVNKWIEKKQLDAFSANFLGITKEAGLVPTVPFLAACRQMYDGVGYAGEGDVLTATFVGAFLTTYEQTSFVEIFCPDWAGNKLLLSHMGEFNPRVTKDFAFYTMGFPYTNAEKPVAMTAAYKGGKALFINIFKGKEDYEVLVSPVTMQEQDPDTAAQWRGEVRGWMVPPVPVTDFLEKISMAGVTHHSILIYDAKVEEIEYFARLLGMKVTVIK